MVKDKSQRLKAVNIEELRRQFRGRPYAHLIQHHIRRQDTRQLLLVVLGTIELLPPLARPLAEGFIDHWNSRVYDHKFWRTDCSAVFDEILADAREVLKAVSAPTDDETLFNMFQIVTLSYAYSASDQPKMRQFMGIRQSLFRGWAEAAISVFVSFVKSWRLRKISKVLGKTMSPSEAFAELMPSGRRLAQRKQAEEELYDLCESDPTLRTVMQKHGADRETLRAIYNSLCRGGAGQWIRGHYVVASALAFSQTLDFVLRKLGKGAASKDDLIEVAYRLIKYFEQGAVGPIAGTLDE